MEELLSRHRKEQRDLQGRVTQKKKQASKKTRKGVNDECDRLEAELKQRQQAEVTSLEGGDANGEIVEPTAQLNEPTLDQPAPNEPALANGTQEQDGAGEGDLNASATQDSQQSQAKKPNRQKARLARRQAEQEEQAKQAAEEARNLPDLKQQERDRMLASMKERGLQEKVIRADGHCLYSAVADQLEQLQVPLASANAHTPALAYKTVRSVAADYIAQHPDDFAPFLEEPMPEYLHKVRDTGEWGGQLELLALAKSYHVDINVLQDFGRVEKVEAGGGGGGGGEGEGKAIWLGYYKHGFGLGEHYNSLRKTV